MELKEKTSQRVLILPLSLGPSAEESRPQSRAVVLKHI